MATELDRFADLLLKALPPPAKKTRITFRTYLDPEPVVELAEGEELLHIVLVPLEPPPRRPDADLRAGQRRYGEPVEPVADDPIPDVLLATMERIRDVL